jgi:hypothetical protein
MIKTFRFRAQARLFCWKRHTLLVHKIWVREFFLLFYIISTQRSNIHKKLDTNSCFDSKFISCSFFLLYTLYIEKYNIISPLAGFVEILPSVMIFPSGQISSGNIITSGNIPPNLPRYIIDILYTLDCASLVVKLKPRIFSGYPHLNRWKPCWSFPLSNKRLKINTITFIIWIVWKCISNRFKLT